MQTRMTRIKAGNFPFMVAPMVGLSHVAFRELVRLYTPRGLTALFFSEMLSSRRLPSQQAFRDEALYCAYGETGLVPQLLGNEEEFIAPSIEKLMPLSPWGIDINMGCPTKKTLGHNWGVLLMGDERYGASVVSITKRHSPVPVSVKLRAGVGRETSLDYLDTFTRALEDAGADWITVHCRPQDQRHRGNARWDLVGELAKRRGIPVVANGDIQTVEDALRLVQEFGVDGAMIARAATARPWILWQIAHSLGHRERPPVQHLSTPPLTPDEEGREYFAAVLRFSCLLDEYYGDTKGALKRLLQYIAQGHRWLLYGHQFWKTCIKVRSLVEARDVINDYRDRYPQPLAKRVCL